MTQGTETLHLQMTAGGEAGMDPELDDDGSLAHGGTAPVLTDNSVPRWLVRLGWTLFVLQLAYLMGFSLLQYHRFALTIDYVSYQQAFYSIAHGHLNPVDTAHHRASIWLNDGDSFVWPLAILGIPFGGNGLVLLWLQDLAIVGTGAVAFSWVLDLTRRPSWPSRLSPIWVVGTCLVLLIANPWSYWTAAFDFHSEPLGAFFLILAARSLERGRFRSCAVWAVCTMLCGALMAAMVAGLGISALLAGRKWRRAGLALVASGVGGIVILASVGLKGGGTPALEYGYLATGSSSVPSALGTGSLALGILRHPGQVLETIWNHRLNIFANLAPAGLVGVLTPWGFGVPFVVLLANTLASYILFGSPGFQNFPLYGFVVFGTAFFLARLGRGHSWGPPAAKWLCGALLISSLFWSIVWVPQTYRQWIHVSSAAARVLARVEADVPPNAEVIVSQGVSGRFSNRKDIYMLGPGTIPVHANPVYFVVAPYQGIEGPVDQTLGLLWSIAGTLHTRLVTAGAGVWAFRWDPPPNVRAVTLPQSPTVPGWALPTAEGSAVLVGPVADWHMASGSEAGDVVDEAYWREAPGRYVATVALASTGPATIEVRNADTGDLLASRHLLSTNGLTDVFVDADNSRNIRPPVFAGIGPARIQPVPPPRDDQLEVRVIAPARSDVSVYSVELRPKSAAHAASHLGE